MTRFEKLALAAAILITLFYLSNIGTFAFQYYLEQIPVEKLPVMIAGWALIAYGPLLVAVFFWRWAKRISTPLMLHLLFLPGAAALFGIGEQLMLSTIQDPDFDAMLGAPVIPAFFLFLATMATYFFALLVRRISKSGEHAKGA